MTLRIFIYLDILELITILSLPVVTSHPSIEKEPQVLYPNDNSVVEPEVPETPESSLIQVINSSHSTNHNMTDNRLYEVSKDGLLCISPTSPLHPWSWPMRLRIFSTIVYAVTTGTVQMSMTYVTADITQIARQYNVGTEVAKFAFSVMLLGNIVGSIILSPLSEAYGRKVAILGSNFVCGFLICDTANVDSIAAFTVFRFIAGIFAGAPLSVGAGAMSDVWEPQFRIVAMALYGTMIVTGSAIAPIFASLLITNDPSYGQRWGAWTMGIFQMVWSFFSFLSIRDTFLPIIEWGVSRDIRVTREIWGVHCRLERYQLTPREFLTTYIMRPIRLFFTPTMLCYNILSSFVYGQFFLLISANAENFQLVHGFSSTPAHCTFISIVIGVICGSIIMIFFGREMAKSAQKTRSPPSPEMSLRPVMIGVVFLPSGCFLYGWSLYSFVHWIVPCIGLGLVGAGFTLVFVLSLVYIVQCYSAPHASYAASAIAANMILRSGLAGGFPLFATQMYHNLGVHWASSLLGFLLVLAIPVPIVFYKLGPYIREGDRLHQELESF